LECVEVASVLGIYNLQAIGQLISCPSGKTEKLAKHLRNKNFTQG
jgi:hypothetical protein